jgi:RNA polymerase sigma-70 factor (ECF subfamily)
LVLLKAPPDDEGSESSEADARLGTWLKQDPEAAAPAIYERFQADVNRWVWRLMGADPDHGDIVQQVFVRVIRGAKRLRDVDALKGWVHAITANTVYGELRRREVRKLFLRDQGPKHVHADLVREVEIRDLLLRAKAIIDKIPAKYRIVFVLHVVEGRTLLEIATTLGYSGATLARIFSKLSEQS